MAVTDDTLAAVSAMRTGVASFVDSATQDLQTAWVRAWDQVRREWEDAISQLIDAREDGAWPTAAQIARADRAANAIKATQKVYASLELTAAERILAEMDSLLNESTAFQRSIAATQYPPQAGSTATISASFTRVDSDAMNAIIQKTAGQVQSKTYALAAPAVEAMKQELVRGMATGANPNVAAREMYLRVLSGFNGGLVRARVIARTEMLDAHRAASRAQQDRMKDVLVGWQWIATLDTRTCPSCLSQHGSEHPLTQAGPLDHQQGRCDRLPITKSWKELGFDIDEPPSALPDAKAWFDDLPQTDRERIMGKDRLALLDDGKIGWGDLSKRRDNDGWRPSYVPTPIKDLEKQAS